MARTVRTSTGPFLRAAPIFAAYRSSVEPQPDKPLFFDEKEISTILKRASILQASDYPGKRFGLSINELQQIAAEAGIDPQYVRAAAAELQRPDEEETNFWGGPLSFSREVVFDATIDERAWEEIVAAVRGHFKDTGEVRTWAHSREWAHSSKNNAKAHLTVTPRDGKTRMQLFWYEPSLAAATYVPLLVLSLMSLPIVFDALDLGGLGVFAMIFIIGTLFSIARFATTRIARSRKRGLAELLARLERIGLASADSTAASNALSTESDPRSETSTPEGRIDLPEDAGDVDGTASRSKRVRE